MVEGSFARMYVLLRPARGGCSGFARMECQHGRGKIVLQASALPASCGCVRALLLAGDAETGSVMDLGCMRLGRNGCGILRKENLTFPSLAGFQVYHTLVLAADWPSPALLLHGALSSDASVPQWQLEEALRRYLTVPAEKSPPVKETPEEQPPQEEDEMQIEPAPPPCVEDDFTLPEEPPCAPTAPAVPDPPHPLTVHCLPPVIWPESIAELKVYFDTLPPFAPFDAPGWRFVRVPLPGRMPAPFCAVGIRLREHQITQVVYAIPGQPGTLPPGGLRGYRWQAGRNGQGYWALWQSLRPA